MSFKCTVCGRSYSTGYRVSHSHRKTRHQWKPNLQNARIRIDGLVRKVRVCTSCIKAGKIQKA
ncbi:MAG TPA: 50S ribosomal protein L28 [Candidatus Fermentibacter daniensis]|jgi:large subunit ribosomal protein L28|nr:MAG: 50S ribosomal protein L28 [Candidatus Fermentibacter daniensis]MBP7719286.1 50S ribosomal protein L28 [Candidatus Fermentibacter sp.]OQC68138.1 MAG: 50S ribosomal protein L28 [candidate division Hyd24-12 bacterium ADurb.Bin004]KZD19372.1 MAG: 50S ribosomal protein L28 [Candidatus Fermentibacter daniensis]KZD20100.1 MAG: 50S ribosomal protein L28 [Candidatus Fermentibacter daniensis]